MTDITYKELELIKESICEACRGLFYIDETGCYERCEEFQKELETIRKEDV